MLSAIAVLLPVFVTMGLGYGAAWHGRFGAAQVPVLNKVVLLYAVPMSVSVGILRLSRETLLDNVGLLLVLILGLSSVYLIAFTLIRYAARADLATSALRAMAIAFPAVPFIGPSLLTPLFGINSAILIAGVALGGNLLLVPFTMVCLSLAAAKKSDSTNSGTVPDPLASQSEPKAAASRVQRARPRAARSIAPPKNSPILVSASGAATLTSSAQPSVSGARSSASGEGSPLRAHLWPALSHGFKEPIVWAPLLALVMVLADVQVGRTLENSLALLGQASGGVGLFTTGIVLQSQSLSLTRQVAVNVAGKNILTPLALLGLAYLAGQGAHAGEIAVTASIMTAPIITTLAIDNGVAVKEMSSTLLLSALASILTTGAFIVYATS